MLTDARSLSENEVLDADLCVVGGGAAGMALARELAGTSIRVALLESGGFEGDSATQMLYEGENVGHPYFSLQACRLRWLGGTTNHWAGFSRPLEPHDFEVRDWIPHSGWPFLRETLEPWYRRAQEVLELGPFRYDAAFWEEASGEPTLALPHDVFVSRVFQRSPPTRFGTRYRDDVVLADNINVFLNANAIGLEAVAGGSRIEAVRAAALGRPAFRVRAKHTVLAMGGIENARILLASRTEGHENGVGNANDLVGRYFTEHPHLIDAFFLPSDPDLDAAFYASTETPEGRFEGTLNLRPEVLRREGLNDISITFTRTERRQAHQLEAEASAGVVSLKHLVRMYRHGRLPEDLGTHVWNVIANLDDVWAASSGRQGDPLPGAMYKVFFRTEQAPNPDSRVTLADTLDPLGVPRVRLDWQLSDADLRSIQRGHELLAQQVGRAGLGRVFFPPEDPDRTWIQGIFGGNHHMGTTRMHDDPKQGVVGSDCRVHGIENLWVAGSSVFPSCGYANPTLTLVALALRLAAHLEALA